MTITKSNVANCNILYSPYRASHSNRGSPIIWRQTCHRKSVFSIYPYVFSGKIGIHFFSSQPVCFKMGKIINSPPLNAHNILKNEDILMLQKYNAAIITQNAIEVPPSTCTGARCLYQGEYSIQVALNSIQFQQHLSYSLNYIAQCQTRTSSLILQINV